MHYNQNDKFRTRYLEKSVPYNWTLMRMVGLLGVATQCFNLVRVLFWTRQGLNTLNNRIYFSFYLIALVLSGVLLIGKWLLRDCSLRCAYGFQMVMGSLFVIWQTAFGIYDIHRAASVGKIGTVTALMAFAALFRMGPLYAVIHLAAGFGAMIGLLCTLGDPNAVFNYGMMAVVALAVYTVRFYNVKTELQQEQTIEHMNRTLEENEEKSLLTNEQYELLLQRGRLIAFEWNIWSGTIRFTHAWEEIFGQPQRIEKIENRIQDARQLQPGQKEEILHCMQNARQRMAYQKKDLLLPVKNGEQRWFEMQMAVQCDANGDPLLGVGLLFDIMDQKSRILALQKELQMDNFTKTLNKTALESYAVRRLHEMAPEERLGMLVLDMDDFKNVNDTYGHICGDYVLVQLGELMNRLAPARTRVGRLGGDEFGAIVDMPDGEEQARTYAAALIREVPGIQWEGKSLPTACSIGIAFCTGGVSYLELYAAADRELYRAKRQGKNRFCTAPLVRAEDDSEPQHLPQNMME